MGTENVVVGAEAEAVQAQEQYVPWNPEIEASLSEAEIRQGRRKIIPHLPNTTVNSKEEAPSTLECQDDVWGTDPRHYRWVNKREMIEDKDGNKTIQYVPSGKDDGKNLKELRLIGQPHIKWEGFHCLIRVDENHSKWYRHFYQACFLHSIGKIQDEETIKWLCEEGATRFMSNDPEIALPVLDQNRCLTLAARQLVKLGVLIDNGNTVELNTKAEE